MVKLDAKTGKMEWYYQQTPHDIYDWDFQDPPLLVNAGGRELAVGAGKSGIVVALDAKTGKPVWKRPVGTHNGHDDDGLLAMQGEYSKIKAGDALPGHPRRRDRADGHRRQDDLRPGRQPARSIVSHDGELSEGGGESTGELVAIDARHRRDRSGSRNSPRPAFGAPTVVNDLVFATTFEGTVHAFDTETGSEVWTATLPAGINTGVSSPAT